MRCTLRLGSGIITSVVWCAVRLPRAVQLPPASASQKPTLLLCATFPAATVAGSLLQAPPCRAWQHVHMPAKEAATESPETLRALWQTASSCTVQVK